MDRQSCFQFKASFSPCTIFQITHYDLAALESQLVESVRRVPHFFTGSPVLIDIEKIKIADHIDFEKIKYLLISHGMVPIGVRGGTPKQHDAAIKNHLPILKIGKTFFKSEKETIDKKKLPENLNPTKLITAPIRSGMQVYAKEADLIVIASVSPGAELLADGHIHVYGPLRGRALAGVQGNIHARIFCRTLEAELVSIAGFYLTKEDMQSLPASSVTMQIYLDQDEVKIEAM